MIIIIYSDGTQREETGEKQSWTCKQELHFILSKHEDLS